MGPAELGCLMPQEVLQTVQTGAFGGRQGRGGRRSWGAEWAFRREEGTLERLGPAQAEPGWVDGARPCVPHAGKDVGAQIP